MNNKKILSTVLAASSVLSSGYLFFMTNNLNNEANKVYAAEDDTVLSVLVDSLVKKLAGKGISIDDSNKAMMIDLLNKLDSTGLKIFTSVDVANNTVTILGQQFKRSEISTLFNRYKVMYFGDKSNDSNALNTLISDMHSYLVNDNGSINYDNLEKLNELNEVVNKDGSNYKIEYKPFTEYVQNVDCLKNFVDKTNFKNYSLAEDAGTVQLVYRDSSSDQVWDIEGSDLQKFLKMLYNLKEQINQVIKEYKLSKAGIDIDAIYGTGSESEQKPETSQPSTDNSYDSSSGGSFVSSSSGSSSTSSSVSTSAGTVSTTEYVQYEKTSVADDALKNGNQVTLNEKITVSNIDALKISDKAKVTTKKVLAKIESILKVANGSTNSSVVDVSKVGSDLKLNNVTINFDKSYIGKDLYVSYIFDDNNIYQLTEGNKWEKLTEDTKEIKGVKMDKTSSLKINGISSACTIVITTKN